MKYKFRKIKFKVWCPKRKRFAPELEIYSDNSFNAGEVKDSRILLQYTGLCDKNGKEIYENDIVSPVMINGTITEGLVIFHKGCFSVKQIGAEGLIDCLNKHNKYLEVKGNKNTKQERKELKNEFKRFNFRGN